VDRVPARWRALRRVAEDRAGTWYHQRLAPTFLDAWDADRDLEELRRLATGARAAAAKSGAEVDGGRFRPHVTLARLRRPTDVVRWLRLLDTYGSREWTVDTVALVRSHLGEGPRGRPRYEVVETFTIP
jgi:2'-5' RNA ligase